MGIHTSRLPVVHHTLVYGRPFASTTHTWLDQYEGIGLPCACCEVLLVKTYAAGVESTALSHE